MSAEAFIAERYRLLRSIALDRYGYDGEDLLQETCIKMLELPDPSMGFALTAMRNSFIDERKVWWNRVKAPAMWTDKDGEEVYHDTGVFDPEPTTRYEDQAEACKVRRVLMMVGNPYREVLERCDLQGKTYTATAEELGLPLNTVRSRLFRAREKFRKLWQRQPGRPCKRY